MNNPLQPRAALALAVAQGEDFNFALFQDPPFGSEFNFILFRTLSTLERAG